MTTPAFLQRLRQRARERRRTVVFPEGTDERVQEAVTRLRRQGLVEPVVIPDPMSDPRFDRVREHVLDRRRHAGVDRDAAASLARQPLYFGASLVALGEADAGVAGAGHSTADVVRAAIHCIGRTEDRDFVSSMFLMVRGAEALSYADCSVIPEPSPEQLASIARSTAEQHRALTGEQPRVAFLSFSTRGSAEHPRIDKVRAAVRLFEKLAPDIPADGELQFDTAYVPSVARRKVAESPVAGRANVFVFPDLDAGNIGYKITERLGGFAAYGPIMLGLRRPFLDLSRGCSADDIVDVAVIAAALAG